MKINSKIAKLGYTLISMLALVAMSTLGSVTAGATVIDVDIVLQPDGKRSPNGEGFGTFDTEDFTLVLKEFAFDGIGSPDNLGDVGLTKDGFTLYWKLEGLAVEFTLDSIKQGIGVGGAYDAISKDPQFNKLSGTWMLSERDQSVPEPGSLVLLGLALVGFGVARYRRKAAGRLR